MTTNKKTVATIIGLFIILYGTAILSLLANPDAFGVVPLSMHRSLLLFLFLSMMLCALIMMLFKDWARKIFMGLNGVMMIYFLATYFSFAAQLVLPFILFNYIAILFFLLPKVRLEFERKWEYVRKSILVVDDDEGSLKMVKGILLPSGYSVLTAMSGERGLQIAKLQKPDLIILDVILPGIKGREVCATLKREAETQNIPVIFLTAKDSLDDIHAEMAVGAVSHLTKPVHAKTLLAEVRRILDQFSK